MPLKLRSISYTVIASALMMSTGDNALAQSDENPQPSFPEPLAEALTPEISTTVSQYSLQMESEGTTWQARVHPSAPVGERIVVSSPLRDEWPKGSAKMIAQYDEEEDGDIWCDTAEDRMSRDIQELSATDLSRTYSFRPPINKEDDKADRKFAEAAVGEVVITRIGVNSRWKVHTIRMWLEKPFKPVMVAKIKSMDMHIQCAPSPSGRMYTAENITKVTGKAMGQTFNQDERMLISGVVEVTN